MRARVSESEQYGNRAHFAAFNIIVFTLLGFDNTKVNYHKFTVSELMKF